MLSENSMRLYAFAIGKQTWTNEQASVQLNIPLAEIAAAREQLTEHHLLYSTAGSETTVTATPPDVAVATLLADDIRRVHELQLGIAKHRGEMLALLPLYREMKAAASEGSHVEILQDGAMVTKYLSEASRDVASEVLAVQPTPISNVERAKSSALKDIELLERGVKRRTLRRSRDREHPPTLHLARELAPHGAEHRTLPVLPLRVMIFDRTSALISRPDYDHDFTAIVVHSKDLVVSLAAVFDCIWDAATPMPVDLPKSQNHSEAGGLSAVQSAVLDGMALGLTDEAIAARVGVSVRTCRRHIASIFEYLGAESRFQAGALAASKGLLRPALLA